MKYEIRGGNFPVLICNLENEESIITQGNAMSWMSPNIVLDKVVEKKFSPLGKEIKSTSFSKLKYTAKSGFATIAFASDFPGDIVPIKVSETQEYVIKKNSFMISSENVKSSLFIQKTLEGTLFGKDGFVLEKLSGDGIAFLELHGSAISYPLQEGQQIIVETGRMVMMSSSCSVDFIKIKDPSSEQQIYNTIITGPGEILLQTMPMDRLTDEILKRVPNQK